MPIARAMDKTPKIKRIFLCACFMASVPYFTVITFKLSSFSNLSTFLIEIDNMLVQILEDYKYRQLTMQLLVLYRR